MLRLSKMTDYGTVIMTHMARDPGRVCSAVEVAGAIGIATPTVSKLLKILAREHLLVSLRGAKGGYLLARPPDEISIGAVIAAIEGPIGMTECSVVAGLCAQEGLCSIRANWQRINEVICHALDAMTLVDMTRPVSRPLEMKTVRPRRARAAA